jgi:hypothetical protein
MSDPSLSAVTGTLAATNAQVLINHVIAATATLLLLQKAQTGATRIWVQQHLADGSIMPDGCMRLLCFNGSRNAVKAASSLALEIMRGESLSLYKHMKMRGISTFVVSLPVDVQALVVAHCQLR